MPPPTYNVKELKGRALGRVLLKMDKVTRDQVTQASEVQKERGGPIGQILVDLGYVDDNTRNLALGFQAGMEYVDLSSADVPPDVIAQIPAQMANSYKVLPLECDQSAKRLVVALGSADNFRAADDLRTLTGFDIVTRIADGDRLEAALAKYYGLETTSAGAMGSTGARVQGHQRAVFHPGVADVDLELVVPDGLLAEFKAAHAVVVFPVPTAGKWPVLRTSSGRQPGDGGAGGRGPLANGPAGCAFCPALGADLNRAGWHGRSSPRQ